MDTEVCGLCFKSFYWSPSHPILSPIQDKFTLKGATDAFPGNKTTSLIKEKEFLITFRDAQDRVQKKRQQ